MSVEKVKEYLKQFGADRRVMEFAESSATVELAAHALHCEECRIAKTLAFQLGERVILIAAAGDARIDNAKYKARFGGKAKMIGGADTEAWTGHAPGGVCPFAVKPGVSVYLDVSLKRFGTVFPACGSANSAIEVTPGELEKFSGRAEWIDVCKNWNVPPPDPGA